jgi:hypothetical protein
MMGQLTRVAASRREKHAPTDGVRGEERSADANASAGGGVGNSANLTPLEHPRRL